MGFYATEKFEGVSFSSLGRNLSVRVYCLVPVCIQDNFGWLAGNFATTHWIELNCGGFFGRAAEA